ncbi:unnamed protein product [Heligmosomoides polygyrus]|uniref:DUF4304 domain-containing protein n=1 Tax=Heligmosomoides polygyrus TaxID=6339 RepID=A0A183F319_HELPZ|nr:unnamed protein product [Heligmosomoides polygyrus]
MTTCLDVAGAIACCDWYKVVLVERFDNTELHVNINSRGGNARIPGNWLPRIITIFFKDRYRQLSPEIEAALKKMKLGKATGHDDLAADIHSSLSLWMPRDLQEPIP